VLQGRGGNDTIYGGAGGDTAVFSGSRGDYTITTLGGKTVVTDKVENRDGTDTLDSISILKFADSMSSTPQTENNGSQVNGTQANDTIYGAAGADNLFGEAGNDQIYGGLGNDRLTGGAGRDVFVFNTKANKSSNVDRILDFRYQDDSLYLDNKYFTKLGSGSLSKPKKFTKDMFVEGKKAKDAEDRIVYDKKSGALYYDADGTGAKTQVKIATIANKTKLTYQDFFVI
jgi:Ca2+-binding RTX toxin-like protein